MPTHFARALGRLVLRHARPGLAAALLAAAAGPAWSQSAPPLFEPAPRSGAVEVQLRPTEGVPAGSHRLVTFGLPLPRGALAPAEVGQVRVLLNGQEIPAWVEPLTPWRHATDPAQDGAWVRVLRIQVQPVFARGWPAATPVTVSWNQGARTQHVTQFTDPRSAWHRVTDGRTATGGPTFGLQHQVYEPDVYAVLPVSWLARAGLKAPVKPMAAGVPETRTPPAQIQARYPGFEEADHAQVNFFHTILNDDEPNTARSASNTNAFSDPIGSSWGADEPWLYDRAMAMYVGYLRSGHFRFLREAVRNADHYRQQLWTPTDCGNRQCVGSFRLKNPSASATWHDPKYSYNESLAFSLWLTGDEAPRPHIEWVTRVWRDTLTMPRRDASPVLYTERQLGFKLMADTVAYEVTGAPTHRDAMRTTLAHLRATQRDPEGGVADGGLWHRIRAHEGNDSDLLITSPWMSALVADAAMRALLMGESDTVPPLLRGLGSHVCGRGSYRSDAALRGPSGGATLRIPHYLATLDGQGYPGEFDPHGNAEHAFDVAAIAAWGAYFELAAGQGTAAQSLARCARELYTTFDHLITSWTRPGTANYDAYRVNPARKYSWWFKNSSGFGWAMAAFPTDPVPPSPQPTPTPTPTPNPPPAPAPSPTPAPAPTPTPPPAPTPTPTPTPPPAPAPGAPTLELRQGVSGYAGAVDLSVSSQYLPYNGGRGVVSNDAQAGIWRIAGSSGYEVRTFLRFGGLEPLRGRRVARAEVVLSFAYPATGHQLIGQYLAVPWSPSGLAWNQRLPGVAWAQPGSGGSDWLSGSSFVVGGFTGGGSDTRVVALDPAVVQAWIDRPDSNHGLLLRPSVDGKVVRMRTTEDPDPALRPLLRIWAP